MRFSQRLGVGKIRSSLQVDTMDDALKNGLWNSFCEDFYLKLSSSSPYYRTTGEHIESIKSSVSRSIWRDFLNLTIDTLPTYSNGSVASESALKHFRQWYFKAEWFEVYDLMEFAAYHAAIHSISDFVGSCNSVLKQEQSAYRFVNLQLAQIISEEEIREIEIALENDEFRPVQVHLNAALSLLTDRKEPNYRNSVKESISAVESYCKNLIGDEKATLGKALNEIERLHGIHKGFKAALSSLYGYTSDSGGIRHALLEADVDVKFEDAKFMLVACSAFINYMKAKQAA